MLRSLLPLLLGSVRGENAVHGGTYRSLSASNKLDVLWSNIRADGISSDWFSALTMSQLFIEAMCPVFHMEGDALEEGRKKLIHTVGAVAKVEWRSVGEHPYTGVFKGGLHGLARLSLARRPEPPEPLTIPGMAVKFLRSGIHSANLVAMESVAGQQSWNFFKHNFSNHIPETGSAFLPVAVKFATATKNIRQVGLSDWSRYGEDGVEEDKPVFPYRLRFQPQPARQLPDAYVRPHTEDLVAIPNGSILYTIYALDMPTEMGGEEEQVGELVLASDMVTSKWADRRLFFRHQDMAEDLSLRPEWNRFTPKYEFSRFNPLSQSCDN